MSWSVSNEPAPVRRAPAKGAPACPTESQEQKALFDWWRAYARNTPLVMLHIPNGGARNAITGARMKAEGVTAGVPDILLAVPRQGCHGLWIELKRRKGGEYDSMSVAVEEVEIIIPESMGRVEALAKATAVLNRVIERRMRKWRAERKEVAVFGPRIEENPGQPYRTLVYRVARDRGGYSLCNVWNLNAYRVTA